MGQKPNLGEGGGIMQEFVKFKNSIKLLFISLCLVVGIIGSVYVPLIYETMNESLFLFLLVASKIFLAICFWIVAVRIYFLAKVLKENKIISHRPGILVLGWVACSVIPVILHAIYLFYLWKQGKKLS